MFQVEVMTDKGHWFVCAEGMKSMKCAARVLESCKARIPTHSVEHFRIIKVMTKEATQSTCLSRQP
jgi:hypothetical protein